MNKPTLAGRGNYAFIDNQNLNLGIQKVGWKLNWRKFREFLRAKYGVEKAFMFIGYMPDHEELYNQMHELGYLIVLKPTLQMRDMPIEGMAPLEKAESKDGDEKKPAIKGNVDAELVLYAVKEMPNYDKAIIVSGDGDFYSLVEYLAENNKLMHLMTPNRQYSTLLKPFDNYIIRLDQFKRELRYFTKKSRPPQ